MPLDMHADSHRPVSPATRSRAFRELLSSPDLTFLMEAHNALSARIVEEAGFPAIWASGLSVATALGLRDANEASWTQVLDVVEFMADATRVPILIDGDTGYGNFNNVRRLVRKLGTIGVAAVCLEDKLFPKMNSFVGERQPLADVAEFCGRIAAGCDARLDDNFSIVARVEALIAGHGMDEALRRAEAYHRAGADAILIHSKRAEPDEILGFAQRWGNRAPVVIVPTKYYRTPAAAYRGAGISTVIWANHNMRASISAMSRLCRRVRDDEAIAGVEDEIATLDQVFAMLDYDELAQAEGVYLPAT